MTPGLKIDSLPCVRRCSSPPSAFHAANHAEYQSPIRYSRLDAGFVLFLDALCDTAPCFCFEKIEICYDRQPRRIAKCSSGQFNANVRAHPPASILNWIWGCVCLPPASRRHIVQPIRCWCFSDLIITDVETSAEASTIHLRCDGSGVWRLFQVRFCEQNMHEGFERRVTLAWWFVKFLRPSRNLFVSTPGSQLRPHVTRALEHTYHTLTSSCSSLRRRLIAFAMLVWFLYAARSTHPRNHVSSRQTPVLHCLWMPPHGNLSLKHTIRWFGPGGRHLRLRCGRQGQQSRWCVCVTFQRVLPLGTPTVIWSRNACFHWY